MGNGARGSRSISTLAAEMASAGRRWSYLGVLGIQNEGSKQRIDVGLRAPIFRTE